MLLVHASRLEFFSTFPPAEVQWSLLLSGNQEIRTTFTKYKEVKDGQWLGVSVASQTQNELGPAVVVRLTWPGDPVTLRLWSCILARLSGVQAASGFSTDSEFGQSRAQPPMGSDLERGDFHIPRES